MLRIVAMYMIVIIHILIKGNVFEHELSYIATISDSFLFSLVLCCVDCYALISGYVSYREKLKYNFGSYINLWIQVVFYGVVVLGGLKVTGIATVNVKTFVEALLPVTRDQYWYFTAYTGVFLFAPLINLLLTKINEQQAKMVCKIFFIFFSLYATIAANLGGDPFGEKEGYSVLWLCILYFFGAAIKKYNWAELIWNKKKKKLIIISAVCVIFTGLWYLIIKAMMNNIIGWSWGEKIFMSNTSPTIFILSVCLLIIFSKVQLSVSVINIVKFCAPTTFGVYLLHMQHVFVQEIIKTRFLWVSQLSGVTPTIMVLLISFIILIIGMLVDRGRIKIFEVLKITKLTHKLNEILWLKISN